MNCKVIATGSTGNAVLLDGGILIDCGVPYKTISRYAKQLRLVLLTHIHGDHFNPTTVRRLHKERPTLRFACGPWMALPLLSSGIDPDVIDVVELGWSLTYKDGTSVSPVALVHDVQNCGWKINSGNDWTFYATDTANLDSVSAKGFGLYLIEANYGEDEIRERIAAKAARGEWSYEARAMQSHLSREQADSWLADNAKPGVSKVIYLHQHTEKNKEE